MSAETLLPEVIEGVLRQMLQPVVDLELLRRKEYLTVEEVSKVFSLNVKSLNTQRSTATGPPYIKAGKKVLYSYQAVKDYLHAHRVRTLD